MVLNYLRAGFTVFCLRILGTVLIKYLKGYTRLPYNVYKVPSASACVPRATRAASSRPRHPRGWRGARRHTRSGRRWSGTPRAATLLYARPGTLAALPGARTCTDNKQAGSHQPITIPWATNASINYNKSTAHYCAINGRFCLLLCIELAKWVGIGLF